MSEKTARVGVLCAGYNFDTGRHVFCNLFTSQTFYGHRSITFVILNFIHLKIPSDLSRGSRDNCNAKFTEKEKVKVKILVFSHLRKT